MKMLYIFLCLLIFNACGKEGNKNKESAKPKVIKIMTYNIRHGAPIHKPNEDVQIESIAAVINKQKPDLVALQEVDSITRRAPLDEAKKLGALTGMHYYFSKTINYQGGAYGDAILSKYPITATMHYMLPMPVDGEARAAGLITVEPFPGIKLDFITTHLELNMENRMAQIRKLIEISKERSNPVILCGDLNATPDSREIKALETEYVTACKTNCPLTFPSDKPRSSIDYIVLNPKAAQVFRFVSYNSIQNILASDHLPLLGYLTLQ